MKIVDIYKKENKERSNFGIGFSVFLMFVAFMTYLIGTDKWFGGAFDFGFAAFMLVFICIGFALFFYFNQTVRVEWKLVDDKVGVVREVKSK